MWKSRGVVLAPKPYLRSVRIDWDAVEEGDVYPFDIPAIAFLDRIDFHPDVTFLVGENGSGKSTLIEAIATCAEQAGRVVASPTEARAILGLS